MIILHIVYIGHNHHHHHQKHFAAINFEKNNTKCQLSFFYLDFTGFMESSSSFVPAFYVLISLESNTPL